MIRLLYNSVLAFLLNNVFRSPSLVRRMLLRLWWHNWQRMIVASVIK